MRKSMRKSIKKRQVKYLANSIEHHICNHPDDVARWLTAFKYVWTIVVTLDNMAIEEHIYEPDIVTLDTMFEQLRNEFSRRDIYMPVAANYYK